MMMGVWYIHLFYISWQIAEIQPQLLEEDEG